LFVTVTAPSFGPVHLGPGKTGTPRPCHPGARRGGPVCGRWHPAGDPLIGTPLDPGGYDYTGQVLFNAHAGALWACLTLHARRRLAAVLGFPQRELPGVARLVFAKVAEYQARGVVHLHAIVRLDGPDGPASTPPPAVTANVLEEIIREATGRAEVMTPAAAGQRPRRLRWGTQLDIRPITPRDTDDRDGGGGSATGDEQAGGGRLSDVAVARYVAKYATKSAEAAGVDLRPLCCRPCAGAGVLTYQGPDGASVQVRCRGCSGSGRRHEFWLGGLSEHARTLVETAWRLGGLPELAGLNLRRWAHMLGFRGQFATKSRGYSTTFGALRGERAAWRAEQQPAPALLPGDDVDGEILVINDWRYAGRGAAHATGDDGSPGSPPGGTVRTFVAAEPGGDRR
jgi:hypothetical protein